MKTIANIVLGVTVFLLALWQLPWLANFIQTDSDKVPFSIYSPFINDFIRIEPDANGTVHRLDTKGNEYTTAQTDSLLPFFYMRQLVSEGRFPDSIMGVAVTPQMVQHTNFMERFAPKDINNYPITLYPLLESMPKRVDLEMPDDLFRITDSGIEFIVMATNSINEAKSARFTAAMLEKGFKFPAKEISGNGTTRKKYDEGYLILDAEGKLFQLKRCAGRPFVRAIPMPENLVAKHIFELEPDGRQFRGFISSVEGKFYVIESNYKVVETGVDNYDPEVDQLLIVGNMLDWSVAVTSSDVVRYYALSADDHQVLTTTVRQRKNYTIPGLHFTSASDKYCYPRF